MQSVNYLVKVLSSVIPLMCNPDVFKDTVRLIKEAKTRAEAIAQADKIMSITGRAAIIKKQESNVAGQENEENDISLTEVEVISTLTEVFQLRGNFGRGTVHLDLLIDIMRNDESIKRCAFSAKEVNGFIAEAQLDDEKELEWSTHTHIWIPQIFKLRSHKHLAPILKGDWTPESNLLRASEGISADQLNQNESGKKL
eukprot:Filipodium_phascolosomae@DN8010_c0_g1_i1.p1